MRSRRFLLGLAVSGVFVAFFLYRADLGEMGGALASADYRFVVPGLLLYLVSMLVRAVRWRVVLSSLGSFPIRRLWPVLIVGYAANNLLPVRLGELVRVHYLGSRENVSRSAAMATILVERSFDGLTLLFLAALVSLFLPVAGLLRGLSEQVPVSGFVLVLGISVPFLMVIAANIGLAVWPAAAHRLLSRMTRPLPERFRGIVMDVAGAFIRGFAILRTPRGVATVFALSLPVWIAESMVYIVLALGFGMHGDFDHMLTLAGVLVLTTTTSNLGTSIPSSAGGVGPFEFFAQATLIFFGVTAATASAFAVALHATMLVPVTLLGLVYLWAGNESLVALARASQGGARANREERAQPAAEGGQE